MCNKVQHTALLSALVCILLFSVGCSSMSGSSGDFSVTTAEYDSPQPKHAEPIDINPSVMH